MKKVCLSQRQIRRKANKKSAKILQHIVESRGSSAQLSSVSNNNEKNKDSKSDNSLQPCINISTIYNSEEHNFEGITDEISCHIEEHFKTESSDSESEESCAEEHSVKFRQDLKEWSVNQNISLSATTSL